MGQNSFTSPQILGDDLTAVVLRRLNQHPQKGSWGPIRTVLLGVPSFGLLPMLVWPWRLWEYLIDESQAMWALAQWARQRGREPAAIGPIMAAVGDMRPNPLLLITSVFLTAMVAGIFIIEFQHVPFSMHSLLAMTYWHQPAQPGPQSLPPAEVVYRLWVIALSMGYFVLWLNICGHGWARKRFIERLNPVIEAEGLPPVQSPPGDCFLAGWLTLFIVLCVHGVWWGIPMALAGMAQRGYTASAGNLVRRQLCHRIQEIVMRRHLPIIDGSELIARHVPGRCGNARCLATLRPGAQFCSRCGLAIVDGIS